jgi:hypothetical protein
MKTQTLHQSESPFFQKKILLLLMLFVLIFLLAPSTVFSQDKGQITSWYLANNPHGEVGGGGSFDIRWDIMRVDASGGHIQAKLWTTNQPECDAYADFKWDIFPDVTRVNQDQTIRIHLSIDARKGEGCSAPTDPYLAVSVMSGTMWDADLGGEISLAGKDLFGYATRDDTHKRVGVGGLSSKTADVHLVVKDRASAGRDRDAKDGGFIIRLSWRGQSYDVFYKYAPSTATESVLNGTWSGTWLNHTFGTSGNCRFEFTENANGQVTASGNEGFGTWTGRRDGKVVFLHTSGKNGYEYWAVLRIINTGKLEIDYLGYGHEGYREGKSWSGRVELSK